MQLSRSFDEPSIKKRGDVQFVLHSIWQLVHLLMVHSWRTFSFSLERALLLVGMFSLALVLVSFGNILFEGRRWSRPCEIEWSRSIDGAWIDCVSSHVLVD